VNAETAAEHPSRLMEDAVTPVAEPVTGRSQPRPVPPPEGFVHDVRFWASASTIAPGIIARCEPCGWRIVIDNDHTLDDLIELQRQHCGEPPVPPVPPFGVALCDAHLGDVRCALPAGHYDHHNVRLGSHSFTWPQS
jgi:hypothetical protein